MALSVDDRLRRIGIPLVSKCDCCNRGHIEDINHVLFEGEFPHRVWSFFGSLIGIPLGRTWKQNAEIWFRRASSSSQVGVIVGIIPIIITWRLWRRRCLARMEGILESHNTVVHSICGWLGSLSQVAKQKNKLSRRDGLLLEALRIIPVIPKAPCCRVVRWEKPPLGWFKLNTDGSSIGNPGFCGIGGVIRDDSGGMVQAYASHIGFGSNNKAELVALLHGLRK